jgi:hypothetical protein
MTEQDKLRALAADVVAKAQGQTWSMAQVGLFAAIERLGEELGVAKPPAPPRPEELKLEG